MRCELEPEDRPAAILDYYQESLGAFEARQRRAELVLSRALVGQAAGAPLASDLQRFSGMTAGEILGTFASWRRELEHEVVLALLAAVEALIRLDYHSAGRRRRKGKRPVDRHLQGEFERVAEAARLDDLLDAWKRAYSGNSGRIGALAQCFQRRHWLAHGRHWADKSGLYGLTPEQVWSIVQSISSKIADFPRIA